MPVLARNHVADNRLNRHTNPHHSQAFYFQLYRALRSMPTLCRRKPTQSGSPTLYSQWCRPSSTLFPLGSHHAPPSQSVCLAIHRLRRPLVHHGRPRPCRPARQASQHCRHPRRRHGLQRYRLLRERDPYAKPRQAGRDRPQVHAVLQHGPLLPDPRGTAYRALLASGGHGAHDGGPRRGRLSRRS